MQGGGAYAFVHMHVVLPPETPFLCEYGAVLYSWPLSGSKSHVLWGFLGVCAATRASTAAGEGLGTQHTPAAEGITFSGQ